MGLGPRLLEARGGVVFFFLLLFTLSSSINCSQRAVITLLCLCFNSDSHLLNCCTIDPLKPPGNSAVVTSAKRPCHEIAAPLRLVLLDKFSPKQVDGDTSGLSATPIGMPRSISIHGELARR